MATLESSDLVVMQQIILAGIERKMFFPQEMDSVNILLKRILDCLGIPAGGFPSGISPTGASPGFTVTQGTTPQSTPLQSVPLQFTPLQGIPNGPSPLR